MTAFTAELIGTALLITMGNGVVANVLLGRSKGQGGGWIVITMGWAMGVYIGVLVAGPYSGAHLNPAVTVALAAAGRFAWDLAPGYIAAQLLGAALGSVLVWLSYRDHFQVEKDSGQILSIFGTGPQFPNPLNNFLTELIATLVFMTAVLHLAAPKVGLGSLDALPVALVVLGIGLSLGGPTGYAINPARDFSPRLVHALLPIPAKGKSEWSYAWVPVLGPLAGALLAVAIFSVSR